MYKVMVIDDEPLIRKTISKLIIELNLNLEIVFEARNGLDAINNLEFSKPNIIITDISMPEMNGLQLMEYIYMNCPHIKLIAISGYSEFQYIKKALSFSAFDYILKPISKDELRNAIDKAINSIDSDIMKINYSLNTIKTNSFKRELLLHDLCTRSMINPYDAVKTSKELLLDFNFEHYFLVSSAFRENISQKIYDAFSNKLLSWNIQYSFKTDYNSRIHFIFPVNNSNDKDKLIKLLRHMSYYLKDNFKVNAIFGISQLKEKLIELNTAFEETMDAMWQNTLATTQDPWKFFVSGIKTKSFLTEYDLHLLQLCLKNQGEREIKDYFNKVLENIANFKNITLADIHKTYTQLLLTVDIALNNNEFFNDCKDKNYLNSKNADKILSYNQFKDNVVKLREEIISSISKSTPIASQKIIAEVETYIKEHFFDDISLVDISNKYHFEPTYFSKLFKIHTKQNFIEYLINVRIEKACEMLKRSVMKINEISNSVGYTDQKYFSQIFKKITGLTPMEYRKKSLNI